jgi:hypothetical protein
LKTDFRSLSTYCWRRDSARHNGTTIGPATFTPRARDEYFLCQETRTRSLASPGGLVTKTPFPEKPFDVSGLVRGIRAVLDSDR